MAGSLLMFSFHAFLCRVFELQFQAVLQQFAWTMGGERTEDLSDETEVLSAQPLVGNGQRNTWCALVGGLLLRSLFLNRHPGYIHI